MKVYIVEHTDESDAFRRLHVFSTPENLLFFLKAYDGIVLDPEARWTLYRDGTGAGDMSLVNILRSGGTMSLHGDHGDIRARGVEVDAWYTERQQ